MWLSKRLFNYVIFLQLLLLAACANTTGNSTPPPPTDLPSSSQAGETSNAAAASTATPSTANRVAEVTATALGPTTTPSPTPIPTATALPLSYFGDPWALALNGAISPTGGTNCGQVDWLDFPLDPPDSEAIRSGGTDFGVFRNRYDKFHAGEDWGFGFNGGSFGQPVSAIGHGFVTYAEPLGWGRDQGVVIVRHTFADGSEILSFYGHLDPPSFEVEAGDCVTRGDIVANIGRPRTSPHLHFEIRTHLPWTPGPGYWPTDPIPEGWLPPSQTIMNSRALAVPGVLWAKTMPYEGSSFLAHLTNDELLLIEQGRLVSRNQIDGALNFSIPTDSKLVAGFAGASSDLVITVDEDEVISGYALSVIDGLTIRNGAEANLEPLWRIQASLSGNIEIIPGPAGDFLISNGRDLEYYSSVGRQLWEQDLGGQLLSWVTIEDSLMIATSGVSSGLWLAEPAGAQLLTDHISGILTRDNGSIWIQAANALYQLPLSEQSPSSVYTFPDAYLSSSDSLLLPNGQLLLAHLDRHDRRLLLFSAEGGLLWQRSLGDEFNGEMTLHLHEGELYLFAKASSRGTQDTQLFWLDIENRELVRLFVGGSRTPNPQDSWIASANSNLLLHIGGGSLVLIDPILALETIQAGDFRAFATRSPESAP